MSEDRSGDLGSSADRRDWAGIEASLHTRPTRRFAVGALLVGAVADLAGLAAAIWTVAALTAASGLLVAVRMYETHQPATRS